MDGFSLSDLPRVLLLVGLPALLVGVPVYLSVRRRAAFERFTRRWRLNRWTIFVIVDAFWAVQNGLEHRWIATAALSGVAFYFLWYSRRQPIARSSLTTP